MTAVRECAAPDCYSRSGPNGIACANHWRIVHPDTKRSLAAAYRLGSATRIQQATQAAIDDMTARRRGRR